VELQEEIRSLRTQLGSFSASLPSTRSWASIAAGGGSNHTNTTSTSRTSINDVKKEAKCLRISTQAGHENDGPNTDTFARNLPTGTANKHIRKALQKTAPTKEVQVAGVGNTRTGYVIRFKDEKSTEIARSNNDWLEELGNGTKLVKARFGVVVHRHPTEGITLPDDKKCILEKIMEENDLGTKGFHIEDVAWLKKRDTPLGVSASLGIWFDTPEAAEWMINNGMVYGQRYIGSVEAYQIKKKRCHRCQAFGHLAWSYKEAMRCGHCGGEHDRRDCPPGTENKCVDYNGPHLTGDRGCRVLAITSTRQ
jgi:hypothetical protein